MNVLKKYLDICHFYGGEETRNTYYGELNYQCSRIFPFIPLTGCAWFPYINVDSEFGIFKYPELIFTLRIGLFAAGIIICLLRLIRPLRSKPLILIPFFILYILWAAALITGLSGGNPSYVGGFLFLIMVIIIPPIPIQISLSILISSLTIFFTSAFLSGFNPNSLQGHYALSDLFSTSAVAALFIVVLHKIRYATWGQRCLALKQKGEIDRLLCNILPKPIAEELQQNTGNIMAGVIGERKFIYDVWGETVNIASRLESNGKAGVINISKSVEEKIHPFFTLEERGIIPVKNAESIPMYFVVGIIPELSINREGKKPSPDFFKKFDEHFIVTADKT